MTEAPSEETRRYSRSGFLKRTGAGAGALALSGGGAAAILAPPAARSSTVSTSPTTFGRIFEKLPPFAPATDAVRHALRELGAKGGPLDAKDDLAKGPVLLITDPSLSVNNPNNPSHTAGTTFFGQFVDHDIGLRDETPAESVPMAFDVKDPLESFQNDFGGLAFSRTPAAPGTGTKSQRQQINTIDSFIDASNVYGVDKSRLDWLRAGTAGDGNPANNQASLLLGAGGYLPRVTARPTVTAPPVDLMGPLVATPEKAVVAGDVRANENVALTAIHTLFAREHNRIVASLARSRLPEEAKFELARRVVGAEIAHEHGAVGAGDHTRAVEDAKALEHGGAVGHGGVPCLAATSQQVKIGEPAGIRPRSF